MSTSAVLRKDTIGYVSRSPKKHKQPPQNHSQVESSAAAEGNAPVAVRCSRCLSSVVVRSSKTAIPDF